MAYASMAYLVGEMGGVALLTPNPALNFLRMAQILAEVAQRGKTVYFSIPRRVTDL